MLSRTGTKRTSTTHSTAPPSFASYPPASTPPTDPLPPQPIPRPSDVLLSRLHELKCLTKSLHAHFSALAAAKHAYGASLQKVAVGEGRGEGDRLRREWLQGSLFLPPSANGGGWAEWCGRASEATGREAQAHLELARLAEEEVLDPLRRLRLGIKGFISGLDKHVNPLAEEVLKERETSIAALTHLATSVAAFDSTPLSVSAKEDPLIVKSVAESQLREQVSKENELLRLVLVWQDKAKTFEEEVLGKLQAIWKWWAEENAKLHLETRQDLVKLTSRLESVPVNAEWDYFAQQNHLIPPETPARNLDLLEYPQRDHPATRAVKEGLLERKKRFRGTWKEAYFVLSPAGWLHEYRSSSIPLNQPHISLFLPACTVHALSQPSTASSSGGSKLFGSSSGAKEKPAQFVIEGRRAATGVAGKARGSLKIKTGVVAYTFRARSYPEAMGWWSDIEKLSKSALVAHEGPIVAAAAHGPAPTAVAQAGLPAVVEHGEQTADEEMSEAEEEEGVTGGGVVAGAAVGAVVRPKEEIGEKDGGRARKESMVTAFETQPAPGAAAAVTGAGLPVQEKGKEKEVVEDAPVQQSKPTLEPITIPGALAPAESTPALAPAQQAAAPAPIVTQPVVAPQPVPAAQPVPSTVPAPLPPQPTVTAVPPPPQHPSVAAAPPLPPTTTSAVPPPLHPQPVVQPVSAGLQPTVVQPPAAPAAASAATPTPGTLTASPVGLVPPPLPARQEPPIAPAPVVQPATPAAPLPTTTTPSGALAGPPGPGTVSAAEGRMVDTSVTSTAAIVAGTGGYPPAGAGAGEAVGGTEGEKKHRKKGSLFGLGWGGRK
ncbi:hypothetical protein JCM8097_002488 [Rhodosporidiobolus ruineniae]